MTDQPDPFGLYHDRVHRDPEPTGKPPLRRLTEAARLLREIRACAVPVYRNSTGVEIARKISVELWAEVQKWSEKA